MKLGGGANVTDPPPTFPSSSLALTDVVVPSGLSELDDPDVALTENVVLGLRRHESGGKIREGTGFRAAAMVIRWDWECSSTGELVAFN